MLSKIKVRLIFFMYLLSSTSVFGNSSENSILIKNQLYNFSTIKNNKDMVIDWKLKGSMMTKYSNNITLIEKPFLNIYKTTTLPPSPAPYATPPSAARQTTAVAGLSNCTGHWEGGLATTYIRLLPEHVGFSFQRRGTRTRDQKTRGEPHQSAHSSVVQRS